MANRLRSRNRPYRSPSIHKTHQNARPDTHQAATHDRAEGHARCEGAAGEGTG